MSNKRISDLSRRVLLQSAGVALASLPLAQAQTPRPAVSPSDRKRLGMVLFDGFQLLDTFGPLEMFGSLQGRFEIVIVGERGGTVKSSAGPAVVVDRTFGTAPEFDVLMIPGGGGTRREVDNTAFVDAFRALANKTPHVTSICTGAAVLAKTGLLDGKKATTNKRAYKWATSQGPNVKWIAQARWVEDGKYFTSSGISAGTDMALGLIERLYGKAEATRVANGAEYEWNSDANHDPFAKMNGLVE